MRRVWNFLKKYGWALILLLLIASVAVVYFTFPEPPAKELEAARKALSEAHQNQSHTFSKTLHQQAVQYYDSAVGLWKKENDRWWFQRNYTQVAYLANRALLRAKEASHNSKNQQSKLEHKLDGLLKKLNSDSEYFEKMFKHIPLPSVLPNLAAKSRLLLSEAELALERGDLNLANDKAENCQLLLAKVLKEAGEFVKDYFDHYPRWKRQFEQVVRQNAQSGGYAIIVDKFAFKCFLYKNGQVAQEFEAEFGKNWVGDKQFQGDKATPEGIYSVVKKKPSNQTVYHLALLLNYPNEEDLKNFEQGKREGRISKKAKIGGLIEIHGHGGQGANWTAGCVALSNSDMNALFQKVPSGTPVLIVGSLKSFNELFPR